MRLCHDKFVIGEKKIVGPKFEIRPSVFVVEKGRVTQEQRE